MAIKRRITAEGLYSLLPDKPFHIDSVFNEIRDYQSCAVPPSVPYNVHPKYELWEVLAAWLELCRKGSVESKDGVIGVKTKMTGG